MLAGDGIQPAGEAGEGLLIGVGVGDLDGTFDRGGGGGGGGIRVFRVARHDVKLLEDVLHAMRPFDPLISDLPPSFFSIAAERSRFLIRFLFLVRSHGGSDAGSSSSTAADDQRWGGGSRLASAKEVEPVGAVGADSVPPRQIPLRIVLLTTKLPACWLVKLSGSQHAGPQTKAEYSRSRGYG